MPHLAVQRNGADRELDASRIKVLPGGKVSRGNEDTGKEVVAVF